MSKDGLKHTNDPADFEAKPVKETLGKSSTDCPKQPLTPHKDCEALA